MASSGPPNFTSEYLNEYHGKPIKVVAILFIVLDTVFVGLRFLSRQLQTAKYGWDDYLIIPAWLSAVGLMIALLGEWNHRRWSNLKCCANETL